jgi:hypothetical protein
MPIDIEKKRARDAKYREKKRLEGGKEYRERRVAITQKCVEKKREGTTPRGLRIQKKESREYMKKYMRSYRAKNKQAQLQQTVCSVENGTSQSPVTLQLPRNSSGSTQLLTPNSSGVIINPRSLSASKRERTKLVNVAKLLRMENQKLKRKQMKMFIANPPHDGDIEQSEKDATDALPLTSKSSA